jgi:hypothetical protein
MTLGATPRGSKRTIAELLEPGALTGDDRGGVTLRRSRRTLWEKRRELDEVLSSVRERQQRLVRVLRSLKSIDLASVDDPELVERIARLACELQLIAMRDAIRGMIAYGELLLQGYVAPPGQKNLARTCRQLAHARDVLGEPWIERYLARRRDAERIICTRIIRVAREEECRRHKQRLCEAHLGAAGLDA